MCYVCVVCRVLCVFIWRALRSVCFFFFGLAFLSFCFWVWVLGSLEILLHIASGMLFFFMKYNTNSDYKLAFFVNTLYIIHSISYRFRQVKILQEIVGIFSDDMIGRVESIHGNAWMRRFYKLFKSILRWPQGTVSWEKIIISTYVKDEIVLS